MRYLMRSTALVLATWSCSDAGSHPPKLDLVERGRLTLPAGFIASGVSQSESGAVVAWSSVAPEVLVWRSAAESLAMGRRPGVTVEAEYIGDTLRSVDELGQVWVSAPIGTNAERVARIPIRAGERVLAAQPGAGFWVVALQRRGRSADVQLAFWRPPLDSLSRTPTTISTSAAGMVWLGPAGTASGLVSVSSLPDMAYRAKPEVTTFDRLDLEVPGQFRAVNHPFALRFAGMPLVPIATGYIRVIADLRSDRRTIVRYDSAFAVRACAPIDAPWSIVAASPSGGSLVALAGGDPQHLIVYEVQESPGSRQEVTSTHENRGCV